MWATGGNPSKCRPWTVNPTTHRASVLQICLTLAGRFHALGAKSAQIPRFRSWRETWYRHVQLMRMPVLVVGTLESERQERADALGRAGFTTLPVGGFLEARDVLTEIEPEALVTDVQLGRLQRAAPGGDRPGRASALHLHGRRTARPGAAVRVLPSWRPLPGRADRRRPHRRDPRRAGRHAAAATALAPQAAGPGRADVRLGHRGPDRGRQLRRRRHRGLQRRPADGTRSSPCPGPARPCRSSGSGPAAPPRSSR